MLTLFKPYGDIKRELESFGDIVKVVGLDNPPGPARDVEFMEKIRTCDILKADVDIKVDKKFIENAKNLKAVLCASIGYDYVVLKDMTDAGIIVANNPSFCIEAVAEYVIGLMFSVVRKIPKAVNGVIDLDWKIRYQCRGTQIFGKTLGLIGFGNIGREVARMAIGLGMEVIAFDKYMDNKVAEEMGVTPAGFEEVLKESDVISVHVPLLSSTKGMIDGNAIDRMKDGVYLINAARGGIVVEKDLLDAVRSGKVAGAALDVLEKEPIEKDNVLLDLVSENIIITPHVAFNTVESAENIRIFYRKQLTSISEGRIPPAVVNPEVLETDRVASWTVRK